VCNLAAARSDDVKIKYFAYIRDYTGEKETHWDAPVADLADLLRQLSARYGTRFRDAVFDQNQEELSPLIIILVNGRQVQHLDGIKTKLTPNDTIAIFPVVAGG